MVRGQLLRRGIQNINVIPVRTTLRNAIGQILAVLRKGNRSQTRGAVGRQLVWIEQNFGSAIESFLPVQNALVLQTIILGIEEIVAAVRRRRVFRIVIKSC